VLALALVPLVLQPVMTSNAATQPAAMGVVTVRPGAVMSSLILGFSSPEYERQPMRVPFSGTGGARPSVEMPPCTFS
jgi:hypothetical protein